MDQKLEIDLRPFEFTDEVVERIQSKGNIPVNFYSKEGQVLINRKEDASAEDFDRLKKFFERGVFYDIRDKGLLFEKKVEREIPLGLTDVKLFSEEDTDALGEQAENIFGQFKEKSISRSSILETGAVVAGIFDGFRSQDEVMTGLLNVVELVENKDNYDMATAVKRATVAMALKTRGVGGRAKARLPERLEKDVSALMMSAIFCDIGKSNMDIPKTGGLTREELLTVQNYPYLSYAMLARIDNLEYRIKQNVLFHRRPLTERIPNNNFPRRRWLEGRLITLREKYNKQGAVEVVSEIEKLINYLRNPIQYDEDANILAISADFSALTSKTGWREAFTPMKAVKMIINQSMYSYNPRVVSEFLDYCSISLCDNQVIVREGDFIVLGLVSLEGMWAFEIAQVLESTRLQSRPYVQKIADITMEFTYRAKLGLTQLAVERIKPTPRKAKYSLLNDQSRRLVYIIDPQDDQEVFDHLQKNLS